MIITVQQHLLQQQRNVSEATGRFTWLMHGITLATKMVESKIRSAGLTNILGAYGETNVQGEQQQKLDVYANQALLHCLGLAEGVAALVSEEDANPITVDLNPDNGKYLVVFDPLDGSSNIDVNVNVGTIFSVLRRPEGTEANVGDVANWALQPGYKQVAAGYVLYGPSTILVYTAGNGVFGFTLDPSVGAFVLTNEKMCMPEQGPYYSTNEGNAHDWPEVYREYIRRITSGALGQPYGGRYIGSLVADFHRTLHKGGVFLYPPTKKTPGGKLRLLYEANPLAFIAEQAGGMAVTETGRILDIEPTSIHQRTPFVVGSMVEVKAFKDLVAEMGSK
ncbi:fructose-1,6-bisphosphatase I [Bryocella elongata]|uniref:Fructose-1,6-bisphosphatase class 1 n=1 Tax=Bryocella elongata TaxID=863522 RepID=A0A1H5SA00_9BACT|nr:class 1 fructose-bisphosphatase [Bryocella elongata]SEF47392.1 fructose-1,6-bisphosphatase I [Bryocella elongata]